MSEFASYRIVMPNDTAATAAYFTSNRTMMPFGITFFLQNAANLKIEKIHACFLDDCITVFKVLIFFGEAVLYSCGTGLRNMASNYASLRGKNA